MRGTITSTRDGFPCQGKELVWKASLLVAGRRSTIVESGASESAMAKLIVISGEERQEFELAAFNTIGRHPDNTIQILDRIISNEHAQIQRAADGRFLLRDLKSLNGTFLRGERVADHYLNDGEEFTMGSTRIVFVDKPKTDDALWLSPWESWKKSTIMQREFFPNEV